jgi:hypothetical protein
MQQYITTDLIKYIISDYIIYDVLVIIANTNFNIRKNRVIIYNRLIKIDDIVRKSTRIVFGITKTIYNYNYKGMEHGYTKCYYKDVLIEKTLYINDIKVKNIKTIEYKKIMSN